MLDALPDPGAAGTFDDLIERLRLLKVWAGDPSYDWITGQVNAAWAAAGRPRAELAKRSTVADCFRLGRRRLNADLVLAVVRSLHPDPAYVTQWQQALRVVGGEAEAAAQVRVQSALPDDPAGFTGRNAELDRLRNAADGSAPVVISAIAGMAGVGKTRLAIRAGHLLARDRPFDLILFVNLRGFHPDPAQPPASPGAVLDGFLRLLGVPGPHIPYGLAARAARYRKQLAGRRVLLVLDNAANAEQVRPLLPETAGCPVIITSRRDLSELTATHVPLDVFTPQEAHAFLTAAAPGVAIGTDPDAMARIARRCGFLPLALSLVAGHIRDRPDWTLTDHADRLDERHRYRQLDAAVQVALDLSYQHLPADRQLLLRLLALHPGQDLDAYAAAALADCDLTAARGHLTELSGSHLVQQPAAGRYALHDLVRGYAAARAIDEDPRPARPAALTRLFDYYLATAAAAMDVLHAAEAQNRPRIPAPGTPSPDLSQPGDAIGWLDLERPALVAVASYAAAHGWPTHAIQLSATLFRHLQGGPHVDALTVHRAACQAARETGDTAGLASALSGIGGAYLWLGQHEAAVANLEQALSLFQIVGGPMEQARALGNLGVAEQRRGGYLQAAEYFERARVLFGQVGEPNGEAIALNNLALVEGRLGRRAHAVTLFERALDLCRQTGNVGGEAVTLNSLGYLEVLLGRYESAADHLHQGLALYRQIGHRGGEAATLDSLGTLHIRRGECVDAERYLRQALDIFQSLGDRPGEAGALNRLGEIALAVDDPAEAITHHTAAAQCGDPEQEAHAAEGLGDAYRAANQPDRARQHYRDALRRYSDLKFPEAVEVREKLAALG